MLYTFAFYLAKNVNRVKIDPGCADVWVFITILMRVKFKDLCAPALFWDSLFWALIWKTITFDLVLKWGNTAYLIRRCWKTENCRFWKVYAHVSTKINCFKLDVYSVIKEKAENNPRQSTQRAQTLSTADHYPHLSVKSINFVIPWQNALMNVGPWWWKASVKVSRSVLSPWLRPMIQLCSSITFQCNLFTTSWAMMLTNGQTNATKNILKKPYLLWVSYFAVFPWTLVRCNLISQIFNFYIVTMHCQNVRVVFPENSSFTK